MKAISIFCLFQAAASAAAFQPFIASRLHKWSPTTHTHTTRAEHSLLSVKNAQFSANNQECETTSNVPINTNDNSNSIEDIIKELPHECSFCSERFSSRNALFRHISICSSSPGEEESMNGNSMASMARRNSNTIRHAFVFKIGYFAKVQEEDLLNKPEAEIAGVQLQDAVKKALSEYIESTNDDDISTMISQEQDVGSSSNNFKDSVLNSVRMSQSSVAMQRHSVLSQEKGCAAAGDIVAISFVGPYSWLQTGAGGQQDHDFMSHLLERTRHHLEELNGVLEIRLVDVEYLGGERNFHAEKSATQQIYHYLLPLAWLKDGKELEKWWLAENQEVQEIEDGLMIQNGTIGAQSYAAFKSEPPTDSLKLLRNALKKAESVSVPNRRVRRRLLLQNQSQLPENSILSNTGQWQNSKREISKVASRKLGTVTNRERRAWHNFADPELKGQASPNHEPVWRVLDRARICNFLKVPHEIEIVAVLEFRGDDFVPQQVRRIVGTTLAVNHGWLPDDIFDLATSAESFMDTVLAPSGRLYLNGVRFHFDEDGIDILQHDSKPGLITNSTCNWLSTRLLLNKGTKDEKMKEMAWLNEVETQSAPQILLQVNTASGYSSTGYTDSNKALPLQASPAHYSQVLKLLRKIVQSRTWPDTSIARSKIIRGQTNGNDEENKDKFGSFTVVNPKAQNGSFDLPLANLYFPDLVDAVFDLEKMLTNQLIKRANTDGSVGVEKSDRISSSHCAVNFNAQFTPHVDSGRGLGQSLSMIVGLGDYNEGEIYVEGVPHQIRYQPLEFDGWGLRHWTNHYRGERFSLVFFTPET